MTNRPGPGDTARCALSQLHQSPPAAIAAVARGLLLLACALSITGCTSLREYVQNGFKVGPNYRRPPAPVAANWINGEDARVHEESANLSRWWTVFNDPVLEQLIQGAFRQNLPLREAGFRVLEARAQLGIAVGNFFPQTQDAFGSYTRFGVSKNNANTSFLPTRFYDQWQLGFNLAWELDFWGRFRRAIEAADANLNASIEDYDAVLVTLLGDVASNYVQMRILQQQIIYTQQNVELQQQTLILTEARFRGGTATDLDVEQAKANLAQTQALLPQQRLQMRYVTNQLSILLGIPPEDLAVRLAKGPIPSAGTNVTLGIPAQLLARRPDVREAERMVAAQCAEIGVAESDLYPHISINGVIGDSSARLSRLFAPHSLFGYVSPGFQWNVLNYGRILNNIRYQDARFQELIAAYQYQVLTAAREVEDGIAQFLQSQERAKYQTQSVIASQKAVRVALVQYRAGLTDFNRVALLEQNLVQQQIIEAQAIGDIASGLVRVYRALGGGWEIRLSGNPPAPFPPTLNRTSAPAEAVPAPAPQPTDVINPQENQPRPRFEELPPANNRK